MTKLLFTKDQYGTKKTYDLSKVVGFEYHKGDFISLSLILMNGEKHEVGGNISEDYFSIIYGYPDDDDKPKDLYEILCDLIKSKKAGQIEIELKAEA